MAPTTVIASKFNQVGFQGSSTNQYDRGFRPKSYWCDWY